MNAQDVANAINRVPVAEVRQVEADEPTMIRISHRVGPRSRPRVAIWLGVLNYVLAQKSGWDYHVCKQYIRVNGRMRYYWNFIAQWEKPEDKEAVLKQIVALFTKAAREVPVIHHQLDSYPLVGADKNRNMPEGGFNPAASGYKQRGAHKIKG